MVAALVEVLQKVVVGCQVNAFEVVVSHNFWNTLSAVFIEGVEREFLNLPQTEVGIIILRNDILNQMVFRLGYLAIGSFPDKHDKVLQEAYLLDIQFLAVDGEGVHRDRMLLGVTDILAVDVIAKSFIGVTRIYQHNVGVLLPQLANHAVGEEGLATS